ncbi:hypothetical protein ACDL62_03755 [Corynebacterium diphtheriae]|uniref:hypothetical protein n=1 Tax=Corynebacterium diphtheriae TaxID=1717 RepID=UPI000ADA9C58|nr:hypothetical protein [Corynebacterium diphtheriae]MBG9256801.1 hypothetical protein [Corynebacterium diphtheriae bv. mitis]CAB0550227.1 hypothetical protein CIP107517_01076 [Corynebacterium diphtheriae]CAB0598176.1 hypothetical protein CIP107535_00975 [Corynebacterium diphtheriae]CAB0641944.1 hypothetical protein CIP107565_00890 [Corynebacterium diphtheriae]CAB0693388.1 hypothetical protein FRC0084_01076 [Corynebacterium diphtheriae]
MTTSSDTHSLLSTVPTARADSYKDCARTHADPSALYLWGIDLSGALQELLGMVEVAVRNSIDEQLRTFAVSQSVASGEWIREVSQLPYLSDISFRNGGKIVNYSQLSNGVRKQVSGRLAGHPRLVHHTNHDDLLSQIMFGTWGAMLPDKGDTRPQHVTQAVDELWKASLKDAFPNKIPTPRRLNKGQKIGEHVRVCATLRNRVNHFDSLLNIDVPALVDHTISPLLQAISDTVHSTVLAHSRVPHVWARRPVPMSGQTLDLVKISKFC